MKHFNLPKISAQSLMNCDSDIKQNFEDFKNERVIQFSKAVPTFMCDVPVQKKLIILIDIVGFSKSTTREQVYTIHLFQRYLFSQILSNRLSFKSKIRISQFVPTGDGCYIVAEECAAQTALEFLIAVVSGFKEIQTESGRTLSLRASALLGECVPFIDMAHHRNYVGEGMNEASRILSGGQHALEIKFREENSAATEQDAKHFSRNSLFVGDTLAAPVTDYADDCTAQYTFPNVADKHGKTRNITVLQGIL